MQALDRIQPPLPMEPDRPERHTREYARRGTKSLFAALYMAADQVIGKCQHSHRHLEFVKFLDHIDNSIPETPGEMIPIVMDNNVTHKTAMVQRWLAVPSRRSSQAEQASNGGKLKRAPLLKMQARPL